MTRRAFGDITNTIRTSDKDTNWQQPVVVKLETQLGNRPALPSSGRSGVNISRPKRQSGSDPDFGKENLQLPNQFVQSTGNFLREDRPLRTPLALSEREIAPRSESNSSLQRETTTDLIVSAAESLRELWARSAMESVACGGRGSRMHLALQKYGRMGPPPFFTALLSPPVGPIPAPTFPCFDQVDPEPFLPLDSDLLDLAADGSLLRSCHEQGERVRPGNQALLRRLGASDREQVVLWLAQVCILRGLNDYVLQSSVILFDRFCAASEEPLAMDRLHLVVIAILGIALKFIGISTGTVGHPPHFRSLVEHLGQGQFSKQDIVYAELDVLQALKFDLAAPAPLDFLDGLCVRFHQPNHSEGITSPVVPLAAFLLQLSLGDVRVLHRFPYSVLAAGAVYVALWCTQATPQRTVALIDDVDAALHKVSDGDEFDIRKNSDLEVNYTSFVDDFGPFNTFSVSGTYLRYEGYVGGRIFHEL
jgi:hypothetical protein